MAHNKLETPNTHFCGIGMENPKNSFNIGSTIRAAGCFNASFVVVQGTRFKEFKADFRNMDVEQSRKRMPCFIGVDNLLNYNPYDCEIVAIERDNDATPINEFNHPRRAFYIFGPEDGSLSETIIKQAKHKVFIPSTGSINVSACAYIVLYDRMTKNSKFEGNQPDCPQCNNYFVKKTNSKENEWQCCACSYVFEVNNKKD